MAFKRWHDRDTFVLFGDMLGFAALVETTRAITEERLFRVHRQWHSGHHGRDNRIVVPVGATVFERRFLGFNEILTRYIEARQDQQMTAIAFSDSFFVAFESLYDTLQFASRVIVNMTIAGIPTRMGLARGTLVLHEFSQTSTAIKRVSAARFTGAGVVRAYRTESCGLKGLRVGVHPSVLRRYPELVPTICIPLPKVEKTPSCGHELNYLCPFFWPDAVLGDIHDKLVVSVGRLARGVKPSVSRHYARTLGALSRMNRIATTTRWS